MLIQTIVLILIAGLSVSMEIQLSDKVNICFSFEGGNVMETIMMVINYLVVYTGSSGVCISDCVCVSRYIVFNKIIPKVRIL